MNGIFNLSAAVIIVLGYLFGFYFQNRRIDDLRDSINQRLDDVNQRFTDTNQRLNDMNQRLNDMNQRLNDMNQRLNDMEGRFSDLKDFIKAENSRPEDRIERLEHPVARS